MNPQLKLALEIVGLLLSIVGLLLLFVQEHYSLVILLLFVTLMALGIVKGYISNKPLQIDRVAFEGRILDAGGHRAIITKITTFTPREKNVTSICDRNLGASGRLLIKETSVGQLLPPFDEGGTISVTTNWLVPLKRWVQYEKMLTMEAIDCFIDERETFSHLVTDSYRELSLRIEFPDARPFKSIQCIHYVENAAFEIEKLSKASDHRYAGVVIANPIRGSKLVLSWEW